MTNKSFEKMTKPQQRVAIAKDALELIHAGRITARRGHYLHGIDSDRYPDPKEKCTACELGALFVGMHNLIGGKWPGDCFNFQAALSPYFSKLQLEAIEGAFEYGSRVFDGPAEDCMIAILQNIIDHNGRFDRNVMYEIHEG